MLQYVAIRCYMLQYGAVCVAACVAAFIYVCFGRRAPHESRKEHPFQIGCVAVCCGVLQCVAVCCSVLRCVAVC